MRWQLAAIESGEGKIRGYLLGAPPPDTSEQCERGVPWGLLQFSLLKSKKFGGTYRSHPRHTAVTCAAGVTGEQHVAV